MKIARLMPIFVFLCLSIPSFSAQEETKRLTLNEAVEIALKNNYDIKTADYDYDIGKLGVELARAAYDGIFSLRTGYSQDKNEQLIGQIFGTDNRRYSFDFVFSKLFPTGTGFNFSWNNSRNTTDSTFSPMSKYWDTSYEFGLSQPLLRNFAGAVNRLNVDIARINAQIMDLSVQERVESKIYSVIRLYWDLYRARADLDITRRSLNKAERLLEISKDKLKRGLLEKGDVYAFEALRSLRKRDLNEALKAYRDVSDALKFELAMAGQSASIEPLEIPSRKEIETDASKNLEEAFQRRRDYQTAKKAIEGRNLEIKLYSNSKYPRLDLVASLRANGLSNTYGDAWSGSASFSDPMWFLGLELELNIDNKASRSNYSRAKIEKARSLIEMKKVEAKIHSDVTAALRAVENAEKQLEETARVKKYQDLKLREEVAKFGQGRSRSETIVNFETELLEAELIEIIANVAYEKSIIDLLYAKNGLLARFLL